MEVKAILLIASIDNQIKLKIGSLEGQAPLQKFFSYAWGTIIHPAATFRELAREGNIRQGWAAILLIGILYSVVCAIAAVKGIEPTIEPILPISKQSYYFWEIFFCLPLYIGGWYLFAWLDFLIGKRFGGEGSFHGILIPLGFALSIPMIPIMWTTDLVCMSFVIDLQSLGVAGQAWNIFYQAFTILWMVALCVIATLEAHKISLGKAMVTTLVSILPVAFIMAIAIR